MRKAFIDSLTDLMKKNEDIIVVTADMGFSVFEDIQKKFPNRFFNSGVTEQSSIGLATGLNMSNYTVFFYAQAPFATMRCFEQIRLDVAYNRANVKIIGTAAGFTLHQLGVSHFALEDINLMRVLPGMTIFTPGDSYEANWATKKAYSIKGPVYIRITKNETPLVHNDNLSLKIGKGIKINQGKDLSLLVSGSLLPMGKDVVDFLRLKGIEATLISLPTLKPIDKPLILGEIRRTRKIFTLEEHSIIGGLGSTVSEIIAESGLGVKFIRFGVADKFTKTGGSHDYLLKINGLSKEHISKKITESL